jgi:hypothetical protein
MCCTIYPWHPLWGWPFPFSRSVQFTHSFKSYMMYTYKCKAEYIGLVRDPLYIGISSDTPTSHTFLSISFLNTLPLLSLIIFFFCLSLYQPLYLFCLSFMPPLLHLCEAVSVQLVLVLREAHQHPAGQCHHLLRVPVK